jgi:hypothetical protein
MFRMTHLDWQALHVEWLDGDDAGLGSSFGDQNDTPKEAALREGYTVIAVDERGAVLAGSRHRRYYLIVDDNGPWGVDVTLSARSIIGDQVTSHA